MPFSSSFPRIVLEVSCSSPLNSGYRWRWCRKETRSFSYRPPSPFRNGLPCFDTLLLMSSQRLDQVPQVVHAGTDDADLGDDGRDEARRRDVERRVVALRVLRGDPHPAHLQHLGGGPLLYRDGIPAGGPKVYRGEGRRHNERYPACPGGEREGVGAHLIRHVPVGGDAVGARYDEVYLARGYQAASTGVYRYPMGNTHPFELPGCEARPLQQGAGLRGCHSCHQATLVGDLDDAQSRAVGHAG